MTLDQLRIFVAVAEREHMTRAADHLHLTQSAVSSAIAALEGRHGVKLFHRVGRGIALTEPGRALFEAARAILDRVADTDLMLAEFDGLERGTLHVAASQTIGGYWLPPRLSAFHRRYPGIAVHLEIANSERVAELVLEGTAELGLVEGWIDDPALARWPLAEDRMALVQAGPAPASVDADWIRRTDWILRETGSGTRSTFEQKLAEMGVDPAALRVALVLPSNEAVRSAAEAGAGAAVLSTLVVSASVAAGTLRTVPLDMAPRRFFGLRHKERYQSKAGAALAAMIGGRQGD
jgi:DNA-binding transcriptional LysR family regulator